MNMTILGGQAYFISDGEPIDNLEFFRPLMEGLGYSFPKWRVPLWLIWLVVYAIQFIYNFVTFLNPSWAFSPFLTPCEVLKTSVTHYFGIQKAKRDFEYEPQRPNDLRDVVAYYQKKRGLN